MLLKFGARNFFCFKEGIEVSLELGNKCPKSISRGELVANLLCVKGANGSGKTNVLKILSFLKHFCCHSFATKPEESIAVDTFFNNDNPIDIFCEFLSEATRYRYELCLSRESVLSEKLSRKVNRFTTVFERREDKLISCIGEFGDLKKFKQRANASTISTAHQYEVPSISPIYNFFNSLATNIARFGRIDFSKDYREVSKFYKENPQIFKTAIKFLKECDLGIADIKIKKTKDENGIEFYFPLFKHDVNGVKNNWLTYQEQSLGTKTLFNTIHFYVVALSSGGVLVMDEFDIDFHPHLLPKFVHYFDEVAFNKKNAQMIFSTHNTKVLEYMGKYRTEFINKESSESYGYRLDEIPGDIIRNDRSIAPVYDSGKIGGVPRI